KGKNGGRDCCRQQPPGYCCHNEGIRARGGQSTVQGSHSGGGAAGVSVQANTSPAGGDADLRKISCIAPRGISANCEGLVRCSADRVRRRNRGDFASVQEL